MAEKARSQPRSERAQKCARSERQEASDGARSAVVPGSAVIAPPPPERAQSDHEPEYQVCGQDCGGRAVLPRAGRLDRLGGLGQEHRAHALGHPLQREDRGYLLHPRRQVAEHEEHPGDELQDQDHGGDDGVRGPGGPGERRERDAADRPGRGAEHEHPCEGPPAPGLGRQVDAEHQRGDAEQQDHLDHARGEHRTDLAEEVRRRRHRGPAQALQAAGVALLRDADGQVLEARQEHAGGDHPGQEVGGEVERPAGTEVDLLVGEDRGEDRQHDDRVGEDEDHGVALALARTRLELLQFFRERDAVIFIFAYPILMLAIFATVFAEQEIDLGPGRTLDFATYFLPGMIATGVLLSSFQNLAIGIAEERDAGGLKRLRGTPMPSSAYFLGKVGSVLTTSVIQMVLLLGVATLMFGVDLPTEPGRWWTFAWVFVLGTASGAICGVAFSSLPRSARSANAVVTPVVLVLQFISGVFFMFSDLPAWMQQVAAVFPLKWMAQGMRSVFLPEAAKTIEPAGSWEHGRFDRLGGLGPRPRARERGMRPGWRRSGRAPTSRSARSSWRPRAGTPSACPGPSTSAGRPRPPAASTPAGR